VWTDAQGNRWLFGGIGYDSVGTTFAPLNDLWELPVSANEWMWVSGPDTGNDGGNYGTLGIISSFNLPPARTDPSGWTDNLGNLWLFGGVGCDTSLTSNPACNDLWEFVRSKNEWVWMSGSKTGGSLGVYGKQGIASPANVPGARSLAATWTDREGNMWLFGGSGPNAPDGRYYAVCFNDLWKYSPATRNWMWMSGQSSVPNGSDWQCVGNSGVYGMLGQPASTNVPGGRASATSWVDAQGNFWLFGGWGRDVDGVWGSLNDLWKFDLKNQVWTWVSGSPKAWAIGSYGEQGTPSSSNMPGAREAAAGWSDPNGNLWLFGGGSDASTPTPYWFNDLWTYSPTFGEWTWILGAPGNNSPGQSGSYGSLGVSSSATTPGGRQKPLVWPDGLGGASVFGGYGLDSAGATGYLNDLWQYDNSAPPSIVLSKANLHFSYMANTAGPIQPQSIQITSTTRPFSFDASASTFLSGNWLSLSPSAATTPANVGISVTAGLPLGTYSGIVVISSPEAANTPQIISATLTVTSATSCKDGWASVTHTCGPESPIQRAIVAKALSFVAADSNPNQELSSGQSALCGSLPGCWLTDVAGPDGALLQESLHKYFDWLRTPGTTPLSALQTDIQNTLANYAPRDAHRMAEYLTTQLPQPSSDPRSWSPSAVLNWLRIKKQCLEWVLTTAKAAAPSITMMNYLSQHFPISNRVRPGMGLYRYETHAMIIVDILWKNNLPAGFQVVEANHDFATSQWSKDPQGQIPWERTVDRRPFSIMDKSNHPLLSSPVVICGDCFIVNYERGWK